MDLGAIEEYSSHDNESNFCHVPTDRYYFSGNCVKGSF
jgi:hypothetical protein